MVTPETENIVAGDRWATLKRVIPHDIYDEVVRFESLVAQEIGCGETGIGGSVQIWSVITHFLRENEPELIECAKDWLDPDKEQEPPGPGMDGSDDR
jgi:hypothetical protein